VYAQGTPIIEEYEKDGIKQRAFKVKLAGSGSTFRLASRSDDAPSGSSAPSSSEDVPF
jgi:hypothetical protein